MSRSYRKNFVLPMTCAKSEKKDKKITNKKLRRNINNNLQKYIITHDDNINLQLTKRDVSDIWCFAKDGKFRTSLEFHYNDIKIFKKKVICK